VRVLVVNAGSSTIKLALLDGRDNVIAPRELPASSADPGSLVDELHTGELGSRLAEADAVGHRIVHGGERFRAAVRIDERVRASLRALCDLAPLHQSRSLAALDAVSQALPELPAVACFDTAFHATLPPAAATYALPRRLREQFGLRRFGFHGLSHAWVARRAPRVLGLDPASLRIVSCHLGAGASLCAIKDGRSLDTTMGFTPLEGLVMATRSGSIDPGMLLWLLQGKRVTLQELSQMLEHESGLFGLSGSADMRELTGRAREGDRLAVLALDVYVHSLCAGIAAMTASLSGIDALVFTGGVGEHSVRVRACAAHRLKFLGVAIDRGANESAGGVELELSAAGARVRTLVLRAREDLEIARQTRQTLVGERAP
jgi:acetate kinase